MKTSKKQLVLAVVLLAGSLLGADVMAASYLDATQVAAASQNVTDTILGVQTVTFPLVMLSTGIAVAFALFKKFVSKAA